MVHGQGRVNALLAHPGITGSHRRMSPVAKYVYQEGAKHGKRVQALGGAKNHVIVMPDADMTAPSPTSANRCSMRRPALLAGSVVVAAARRTSRFATSSSTPRRICGLATVSTRYHGWGPSSRLGTGEGLSRRAGRKEGATLLLDGARARSTNILAATLSAPPSSMASNRI